MRRPLPDTNESSSSGTNVTGSPTGSGNGSKIRVGFTHCGGDNDVSQVPATRSQMSARSTG